MSAKTHNMKLEIPPRAIVTVLFDEHEDSPMRKTFISEVAAIYETAQLKFELAQRGYVEGTDYKVEIHDMDAPNHPGGYAKA